MNSDELLKKIHSEGYWRVNIRPTRFEKERIGSLAECKEVVEACQVQLGLLAPATEISITLYGMEGRKLFFWNNPERALFDDYISQISEIPFSRTFEEAEVRSRSTELALEAILWIFERFNWTAPKEVLAEDQSRLLERRL